MGLEKDRFSRLKGRSLEKKIPGAESFPAGGATEAASAADTGPSSRLVGKSLTASHDRAESHDRSVEIAVGMKVVQRDDPEADWHVLRITESIVTLRDHKRNATLTKKLDNFLGNLATPGSAWRIRD